MGCRWRFRLFITWVVEVCKVLRLGAIIRQRRGGVGRSESQGFDLGKLRSNQQRDRRGAVSEVVGNRRLRGPGGGSGNAAAGSGREDTQ